MVCGPSLLLALRPWEPSVKRPGVAPRCPARVGTAHSLRQLTEPQARAPHAAGLPRLVVPLTGKTCPCPLCLHYASYTRLLAAFLSVHSPRSRGSGTGAHSSGKASLIFNGNKHLVGTLW